jgi:hypothetical protein
MKSYLRPSISTFLVVFFFLILMFLGVFAEVFESQTPEVDLAQIYANPVPVAEISRLKTLRLTNKQGSFLFENTHPEGLLNGPWQMVEPQSLRVKGDVVKKIVETLNVIRVRNFHLLEPINLTSYSLDNPTLSLIFTNSKTKSYEIKIGLINPIDNSAYMQLSSQDQIYQIDPLEMALESYDLAQLVESKVLAINMESLASLEIYGQSTLNLKLMRKDDQWVDQNGAPLAEAKVRRFIEKLEDMKSFSILDNLSVEQKEHMAKVMASPAYGLKLITNQGVRNYLIAESGNIPGIEKSAETYSLSSEERQSFVLITRDQVKILETKFKDLK